MARIRKFVAYRRLERPYTRTSKYKEKSYIKVSPHIKISKFDMGADESKFSHKMDLVSKADLQIRHDAIESSRVTATKLLEKTIGEKSFHFKIRIYPHHILRENPLAAGAGADRLSTGMAHSFGKPIGRAAQVKTGQPIISLYIDKNNLELGKKALKRAQYKIPCSCLINIQENRLFK